MVPPLEKISKNALAKGLGKDRKIIMDWIILGCPHELTDQGHYQFDLFEVLNWRESRFRDRLAKRNLQATSKDVRFSKMICDSMFFDLENWERHNEWPEDEPISAIKFAGENEIELAEVLRWLKMGCPHKRKGDLETGKGITLDTYQVFDWVNRTNLAVSIAGHLSNFEGRPYAALKPVTPTDDW